MTYEKTNCIEEGEDRAYKYIIQYIEIKNTNIYIFSIQNLICMLL